MWQRIWAIFHARNLESLRDRSALAWNLFFPLALMVGFSFFFSGQGKNQYSIAVVGTQATLSQQVHWQKLWDFPYLQFNYYPSADEAEQHLSRHQIDLVVAPRAHRYWVNSEDSKSIIAEQLVTSLVHEPLTRAKMAIKPIGYVDWFLPGVLGMNVLLSGLWGVGYAIVRYRKNGVLKRLQATPVRPLEFLVAQVSSRLVLIIAMTVVLYFAAHGLFDLTMQGSVWILLGIFTLGAAAMVSLGLLLACRSKSEEMTGGLVNLISWPMVFLSQVWFSLESAPRWVQQIADCLPLTQVIRSARHEMLYGTLDISDIYGLIYVAIFALVCLVVGAGLFRWS